MRFKKADNSEIVGTRITGITLNGLNYGQRHDYFTEWAKIYCEYFPSLKETEMSLPFAIKLPDFPMLSAVKGIYVLKGNPEPVDLVMIHYEKGINGITLTITHNFMELQDNCIWVIEQIGNTPMTLGWSDGDLCYIIYDGREDYHTQEELTEVLLSLK